MWEWLERIYRRFYVLLFKIIVEVLVHGLPYMPLNFEFFHTVLCFNSSPLRSYQFSLCYHFFFFLFYFPSFFSIFLVEQENKLIDKENSQVPTPKLRLLPQIVVSCPAGLHFPNMTASVTLVCQEDGAWTAVDPAFFLCREGRSSVEFCLYKKAWFALQYIFTKVIYTLMKNKYKESHWSTSFVWICVCNNRTLLKTACI